MTIQKLIIVCFLLFSSGTQAAEHIEAIQPSEHIGAGQNIVKKLPEAVQNLLQYALSNEGISYHRGGTSPESGFDCSGFVRNVFDHVEGVMLPHGSNAMSQIGNRIKMTELLPGDLVFFRIMHHTISHVGIYLGNNQFIHASSTRTGSVMISNLDDNYWVKHFSLARRLVSQSSQTDSADASAPLSLSLESRPK